MDDTPEDRPSRRPAEWNHNVEPGELSTRELFRQISHIAQFMSHDLVDKLRWYEQDSLTKSDEELEERLVHMRAFLKQFQAAYDRFSEVDF